MSDSAPAEDALADGPSALEAVVAARERTLSAATSRIAWAMQATLEMPPRRRRRHGGILRPLVNAGKAAGKRLFEHYLGRMLVTEGVLDLAQRRCMVDNGSSATLYSDGRHWSGDHGRPLATLPPIERRSTVEPLWLFDLLAGLAMATEEGTEDVRGTPCWRVAAATDLSRASHAVPGGIAAPSRERFDDLLAVPVEVWIDDTHVRRVRCRIDHMTQTLELWEFGVPLDDLDWSRLPTFRTGADGGRGRAWKRRLRGRR